MKNKKVILAFSGGLDTSFCVLWLKKQGFDVITLTVDTGGFSKTEKESIEKKAEELKVFKHYFLDAKKEFFDKIVAFIIKGNILRGGVYPLCAGPERIIIAEKLVEIAEKEQAGYVAHGSTGAGNDQVRFDVTINTLAPNLKIIASIRQLSIQRNEEIKFLKKQGIAVFKQTKSYSVNKGMLGTTIGGKETKNSWESVPDEVYEGMTPISQTPDQAEICTIKFSKGLPKAIKHFGGGRPGTSWWPGRLSLRSHDSPEVKESGIKIIECLNKIGSHHGVGKGIHLGTTILGIKGRVAFFSPAILILIKAHQELEKLVLTKDQLFWKNLLTEVYGNLLHEAKYFDPLARDIEAMIESSQKHVTGEVRVKLYKGNSNVEGVKSPYSLLDPEVAVYGEKNSLWTGSEAEGFCKIYGVETRLVHSVQKGS